MSETPAVNTPAPGMQRKKAQVVLEKVPSSLEQGTFESGRSDAGKWKINMSGNEFGKSIDYMYDGKFIPANYSAVMYTGFDFNVYKNQPTPSLKLSGTSIYSSSVPAPAKAASIASLSLLMADSLVLARTMKSYIEANQTSLELEYNQVEEKVTFPAMSIPIQEKQSKADPTKPDKDLSPFYSIGAKLRTDRKANNALQQTILIPITLNGKLLKSITREAFYQMIKGGTYFMMVKGYYSAFMNKSNCYIGIQAESIHLARLKGVVALTNDEEKTMIDETTNEFNSLGIGFDVDVDDADTSPTNPDGSSPTPGAGTTMTDDINKAMGATQ